MIPHRMLGNEIDSNGLRERVSACRKRLRVNRSTHKQPHTLNEATELFPEIVPARERTTRNDSEELHLTEELEVGIT